MSIEKMDSTEHTWPENTRHIYCLCTPIHTCTYIYMHMLAKLEVRQVDT